MSAIDVDDALTAANAARATRAAQWAEEATDVEVETGQYSAKHHSEKSGEQRRRIIRRCMGTARDSLHPTRTFTRTQQRELAATIRGQFQIVGSITYSSPSRRAGPVATEMVRFSPVRNLPGRRRKTCSTRSRVPRGQKRYSPAAGAIIADANGRCTRFIPVTPGDVLTISWRLWYLCDRLVCHRG